MARYLEKIKYVEWNAKVFFYITNGSDLLSSLIWMILITVDVLTHPSPCTISRLCVLGCHGYLCVSVTSAQMEPKQSHTYTEKNPFSSKELHSGSHFSLSLHRSLFTQKQQNIKHLQKCQHSCSFGVGQGERMGFFSRGGVEWLFWSHDLGEMKDPQKMWGLVLPVNCSSIYGCRQGTEWVPATTAISSPSPRSRGSSRLEVNHHKMQYQVRIQAFCPLFHLL